MSSAKDISYKKSASGGWRAFANGRMVGTVQRTPWRPAVSGESYAVVKESEWSAHMFHGRYGNVSASGETRAAATEAVFALVIEKGWHACPIGASYYLDGAPDHTCGMSRSDAVGPSAHLWDVDQRADAK